MNKFIYLDYCATTPTDPMVMKAMQPFFSEHFGNSASQLHPYGWEASTAVEKARKQVALGLKCAPQEIYFTSGATESNNWAIIGLVEHCLSEAPGQPIHIISAKTEHNSILGILSYLKKSRNIEVDFLPVNSAGMVTVDQVQKSIKPHTKLISLMWVNNELGSIHPISEISSLARQHKIYFHSDATQAVGKIPIDLQEAKIDLLSLSGHKIYGPKGVGALFIRKQDPVVSIHPLFHGGGQEKGLRSGTVNVPGVVGLGQAMENLHHSMTDDLNLIKNLRERILTSWQKADLQFRINGEGIPHILNVTFLSPPKKGLGFPGIAFSKGSACHSDSQDPSHVLSALGIPAAEAVNTFRFSLGRTTTAEEIEQFLKIVTSKFT